ncbi:MAG TPA: Rrf2 family transcriptional regulator [Thermoleophilia bacterium]|jgi:Rrf2 family protein|nr:Rrf2 family transcriptional regulator [Thermoleophilia bacterium]
MRLELTKRGDYAVRAMIALARDGQRLMSARTIAADMAIPPRFLPQVMGDLVRAGLVEGVTGRSGGYRLSVSASEVSLLTIIEAVEGTSRRETCVLRGGPCGSDDMCAVHGAFIAAEEAMIGALDSATLAEVSAGDQTVAATT